MGATGSGEAVSGRPERPPKSAGIGRLPRWFVNAGGGWVDVVLLAILVVAFAVVLYVVN